MICAVLNDEEFGRGPLAPCLQQLVRRYLHVLDPSQTLNCFGVRRALTDQQLHRECVHDDIAKKVGAV